MKDWKKSSTMRSQALDTRQQSKEDGGRKVRSEWPNTKAERGEGGETGRKCGIKGDCVFFYRTAERAVKHCRSSRSTVLLAEE